jgi:hypothetical protein
MDMQPTDHSARNGRTAAVLMGVLLFLVALTVVSVIVLN